MGSMAEVYDRSEYTVTTLLLFGPQVLSFNKEALDKLRDGLSKDGPTQNQWVLDTVAGLPEYWKALMLVFVFQLLSLEFSDPPRQQKQDTRDRRCSPWPNAPDGP